MKIGVIFILVLLLPLATAANLKEYYFNPKTGGCISSAGVNSAPKGFFFSGYNDTKCEIKLFNMTRYQECEQIGGTYTMQALGLYTCETPSVALGYVFMLLILALVIGLFFLTKRNSS